MERPGCPCHSKLSSRGRGYTLYSNNPTQHNLEKQLETIGAHEHANYYQEQRIRAKPKILGKVPRIRPEPLRIAAVQFPTDYDDDVDYDDEGDNNNLFMESPINDYDEDRNAYSAVSNFERYDDDTFDFSTDNQVSQIVPESVAVKQDKNLPPKTGKNSRKKTKRLNVAINNIHKLKE